jgi:hypothetical protein
MSAQVNQPADVEMIRLPKANVVTGDGVPVEMDLLMYFKWSPTELATAYRVISNVACKLANGAVVVWMVGPSGRPMTRNPLDHTTDLSAWVEFYQQRHSGRLPPMEVT